jgi:hypothetical protein
MTRARITGWTLKRIPRRWPPLGKKGQSMNDTWNAVTMADDFRVEKEAVARATR